MNTDELKSILEQHRLWLEGDEIVLIEEVKHLQQLDWKGEKP